MPRIYQKGVQMRKYQAYSEADLTLAVAEMNNGATFRQAEIKFKIPRQTICNRVHEKHSQRVGRPSALSEKEEKAIVSGILCVAEWGFPINRFEIRIIIRDFLKSQKKKVDCFKKNMPGPDFEIGFLERHRTALTTRTVEYYSRKRASVTSEVLNSYFDNLSMR